MEEMLAILTASTRSYERKVAKTGMHAQRTCSKNPVKSVKETYHPKKRHTILKKRTKILKKRPKLLKKRPKYSQKDLMA